VILLLMLALYTKYSRKNSVDATEDFHISLCLVCVAPAQSPETEVADMLRSLGDIVNEQFGEILSQGVAAVLPLQTADRDIPYAALQSTAESLIAHVHGWSQVAIAVCIFL